MARDSSGLCVTVLFLEENGCPMTFYIKPGPTKDKILPLIERGGGEVSVKQNCGRNVIKLTDPEEAIEGYISTEFIFDSVQKQFLQDIEKYRMKKRKSNRVVKVVPYFEGVKDKKYERKFNQKGKRLHYTKAEELAILNFFKKNGTFGMSVHGNKLWQYMASVKVTRHSWQSMRTRYLNYLMKQQKCLKNQSVITKENFLQDSSGSESDFEEVSLDRQKVQKRQQNSKKNSEKQSLFRKTITRSQRKALVTSDESDDCTLIQGVQTRSRKKASESDMNSEQNTPILRTKGQRKVLSSTDDTDEHPWHQRAQTRRLKRSIESVLHTNGTEKESELHTEDSQIVDGQQALARGHKKVIESSNELEGECGSQPVPRQVTPVIKKKSNRRDKFGTKRRSSPRNGNAKDKLVSDIDPETRINITKDQSDVESESDEFDRRLMDIAKKSSFNLGCQESPNNDLDEESGGETSAKDTQEEDDGKVLFEKKKKTKRSGKNKNEKVSSPKGKQTYMDTTITDKHTRSQSATKKNLVDRENSTGQLHSSSKVSKADTSNTKATPNSLRWDQTELTLESCSRQLFGNEHKKDPLLDQSKGKTRKREKSKTKDQITESTRLWNLVEKMFENYQKAERLSCVQGMTKLELLHALYVSNGSLEDTENYIKKGNLANGASPWSKVDNDAILANDREAVESIIGKRGRINVSERRSFLRGCR